MKSPNRKLGRAIKIYVSGTFADQKRLRELGEQLLQRGHELTSSWLQETKQPENLSYDDWMHQLAAKDVAEVFRSDCIIMDLNGTSTSGGRYVEWGVASHPTSPILRYLVGAKPAEKSMYPYGCFNLLAHRYFQDWDELLKFLDEEKK